MNLPTLRQLQYLCAVVELRHFGQAADRCFVTQSTLSAGIQDLEQLLGVSLLERTNRKVIPTPLGIETAQQAKYILSLSTDLVELARSEVNPLAGRVRIGVIPSISPFLLPKVLPTIRKQLPEIELVLVEDQSERLLKKLESSDIDVAILAFPYKTGNFSQRIFAQEQFYLALPINHPLATYSEIHAEDLPVNELLLLSEGHCLREHALSACQLPTTVNRASVQGTSLYTLIEMVAGGLGITLIPEMAIQSDMVQHADICIRRLATNDNKPMRELGLLWRPSYKRLETLEHLSQYFAEALQ